MDSKKPNSPSSRPLSPHLQIYRPSLTMMMSIAHRLSGLVLYFGMALIVGWLVALAFCPAWFSCLNDFLGSAVGLVVLVLFSWALFHHLLGGVKHLIWDVGYGLDREGAEWMARGTLFGAVLLTALFWLIVWSCK